MAAAEEPAGRFGYEKCADDEDDAGRERDPEDAAPGGVFEVKERRIYTLSVFVHFVMQVRCG